MNGGRIRFQADADLDMTIVRGLRRRQPAIDIQSADDAGLRGVPDADVLAFCARQGRILVSHDKRTMPGHFATFLAHNDQSPGVFLIDQAVAIGTAIESLYLVWAASEPEEWTNRLERLPW